MLETLTLCLWDYCSFSCVKQTAAGLQLTECVVVVASNTDCASRSVHSSSCAGACVSCFSGHTQAITALHVDSGIVLSGSADGCVRVWDMAANSLASCLEGTPDEPIVSVRSHFAASPKFVVTATTECCRVWDRHKAACLHVFPADVCGELRLLSFYLARDQTFLCLARSRSSLSCTSLLPFCLAQTVMRCFRIPTVTKCGAGGSLRLHRHGFCA